MNALHRARLTKLASFLEALDPARFDFSRYCAIVQPGTEPSCGSLGCAVGYCPIVFPEHWEFRDEAPWMEPCIPDDPDHDPRRAMFPRLRGQPSTFMSLHTVEFFGISTSDHLALFVPKGAHSICCEDSPDYRGFAVLHTTATPQQVARNIRTFLRNTEPETT